MKTAKIKITPIQVKGEKYWQLVWPKFGGGRNRRAFKLKAEAEREMAKKKAEVASYGAASASIPDKLRAEAVDGYVRLKEYGKSLRDAVDFYESHLKTIKGSKGLKEAVEEFLRYAKSDGAGERYLQSLKVRLGKLVEGMPSGCTTAGVTTDNLAEFLLGFGEAETKRSYKANIKTFFNWCVTKNYCQGNPADRLKKIKGKDHKPGILLPEELAGLLEACDDSILPGVVLGAFCGVRQAEIARLDWSAIDLEEKIVTIDGTIAKTGSRRTIKIADNAVAWLLPFAKEKGAVWPTGEEYRAPWNIARLRCGWGPFYSTCAAVNAVQNKMTEAQLKKLKPWPENALRHSFISYALAKTRDLAEVATEAGNSPNMVKKHYLRLVKPPAAEAWFAIRPALVEEGKVTKFEKAEAA